MLSTPPAFILSQDQTLMFWSEFRRNLLLRVTSAKRNSYVTRPVSQRTSIILRISCPVKLAFHSDRIWIYCFKVTSFLKCSWIILKIFQGFSLFSFQRSSLFLCCLPLGDNFLSISASLRFVNNFFIFYLLSYVESSMSDKLSTSVIFVLHESALL